MNNFEWNYFPIREIIPNLGIYAIGARFTEGGGMEHITCDKEGNIESVRVEQLIPDIVAVAKGEEV